MKRGSSGICALVAIDKPRGCSSHDIVSAVRRATGERRVGHAGTLDPFATGLIVVGIGPATRLLNLVMDDYKSYNARISFGCTTSTDDLSGEIIEIALGAASLLDFIDKPNTYSDQFLNPEFAQGLLDSFLGEQTQLPPAYSAKKIAGKKSYELARAGEKIKLSPVDIEVTKAKLVACGYGDKCFWQDRVLDIANEDFAPADENYLWSSTQDEKNLRGGLDCEFSDACMKDLPWWDVSFLVSKGTYIRALARDIGNKAGCGAFLSRLSRTSLNNITLENAIAFDDIGKLRCMDFLESVCLDPCEVLELPCYDCSDDEMTKVNNGSPIEVELEHISTSMHTETSGTNQKNIIQVPQNICVTYLGKMCGIYTLISESDAAALRRKTKYKSKLVIPGGIIGVRKAK